MATPGRKVDEQHRCELAQGRQLWPAEANSDSTASSLKGGVNVCVEPPETLPPEVVLPLLGSNHSTFSTRVVADKFTVKLPPFGAYTRYSAPTDGVCAKQ